MWAGAAFSALWVALCCVDAPGWLRGCTALLAVLLFALRWPGGKVAVVLVLGDIGRSPRMQYHALSLHRQGSRQALRGRRLRKHQHAHCKSESVTHNRRKARFCVLECCAGRFLEYSEQIRW